MAFLLMATPAVLAQPTTTIITHGFSIDSKGAWVQGMAEAIIARAGAGSIYRYTGASGALTYVPAAVDDGSTQNIVIIFHWVPESDGPSAGPNWNYAQAAADVLYALLRAPTFIDAPNETPGDLATGRVVHFIGHSRGACVNSEAARRLAIAGIPVDHVTTLDPHPVNGTLDSPFNFNWNDPVPKTWSNVAFADNYWRADGGGLINGFDFDGISLADSFNTQLSESALNCCAYGFAHSDVHLWHHGTVDLAPNPCDGEQCISAQMRQTWWPKGYTQKGYYYAFLGGGSGDRPLVPPVTPPGELPIIFGGDFAQGSYAGWLHHGGAINGSIMSQQGDWFVRLGPGANANAIHNRFFLPENSAAIAFDLRITTPAALELLRLSLIDANGVEYEIGSVALNVASDWSAQNLSIPATVPRVARYTLSISLTGRLPINAVVDLDDINIALEPPNPGDITDDGCVDVDDLLAVINTWGSCKLSPCAADINQSGAIDVDDLLIVINNWQPCAP
jgi:hypothetical protein